MWYLELSKKIDIFVYFNDNISFIDYNNQILSIYLLIYLILVIIRQ